MGLCKAGTLAVIGAYPELERRFPIDAVNKNLTLNAGNGDHRRFLPRLLELPRTA